MPTKGQPPEPSQPRSPVADLTSKPAKECLTSRVAWPKQIATLFVYQANPAFPRSLTSESRNSGTGDLFFLSGAFPFELLGEMTSFAMAHALEGLVQLLLAAVELHQDA